MPSNQITTSRVRRTVNDLILAEMFLVQATIESANVIGDGLSELGRQVTADRAGATGPWDSVRAVLQRTADDAVEPYTSRFRYLREIFNSDS